MTDWAMRQQVKRLVMRDPVNAGMAHLVDGYASCVVEHRDRLRIVALTPPVLVCGWTIRYALFDGDECMGAAELWEDAKEFLREDTALEQFQSEMEN